MRTLGELPNLPPKVLPRLEDLVEVEDGVRKRRGDCTLEQTAGALEMANEGVLDRVEIARLLEGALALGIKLPAELSARLDALEAGVPAAHVIAVRDELRKIIPRPRL